MPRPFRPRILPVVLLSLVAAGCSQGPGATGAAGTNVAATGPAATAGGPAPTAGASMPTTGGGTGSSTPACDLLSDAELKELTDLTVSEKDPEPVDTVYANTCRWTFAEHGEMDLGVLGVDARASFDRLVEQGGTEIAGLGDRAVKTELTGSLLVLTGDTMLDLFTVGTGTSDEVEQALLRRVIENLGR